MHATDPISFSGLRLLITKTPVKSLPNRISSFGEKVEQTDKQTWRI